MDHVTGILDRFRLGVSADGKSCVMVFVDEMHHSINCVASYMELDAFIAGLNDAANEMARRRTGLSDEDDGELPCLDAVNVTSAAFEMNQDAGYLEGTLVGDAGQIVGIRMSPEVACQLTRAMLMTAPAASSS